jgi:hypothetical protein
MDAMKEKGFSRRRTFFLAGGGPVDACCACLKVWVYFGKLVRCTHGAYIVGVEAATGGDGRRAACFLTGQDFHCFAVRGGRDSDGRGIFRMLVRRRVPFWMVWRCTAIRVFRRLLSLEIRGELPSSRFLSL